MKQLLLCSVIFGLALAAGCKKDLEGENGEPPLRISILFDDKQDLGDGSKVYLKGFEVGIVESVTLDTRVTVNVAIAHEHKDDIRVRSFGKHRMTGGLQVVVVDEESPSVAEGAVLEGADNTVEEMGLRAQMGGAKALDTGKELVKEGKEAATRAAEQGAEASKEAGRMAAEKSVEAYEALRDSGAVEATKEAGKAGVEATKEAGKAAADKSKELFDSVKDSGAVDKSKDAVKKGAGAVKDRLKGFLD